MIVGVQLGLLVGACPTVAMIIASALLSNVDVGAKIEACFQNFAAGLIIAAVAAELFPLMLDTSADNSRIGISIGFAVGLGFIYGVEHLMTYLEERSCVEEKGQNDPEEGSPGSPKNKKTFPKQDDSGDLDMLEEGEDLSLIHKESRARGETGEWATAPIERASMAISSPSHRQHIETHLHELNQSLQIMEDNARQLADGNLNMRQTEDIAEMIDEEVHRLQYKLDHCRRLVQGSEIEIQVMVATRHNPTNTATTSASNSQGSESDSTINPQHLHMTVQAAPSGWITEDRVAKMRKRLNGLKNSAAHLLEHIREPNIDKDTLKEIHEHIDVMDRQIDYFHASVEHLSSKWHRCRELPATMMGDKLPMGLVVPVTIDCFVDGFLIGVSVALSPSAGFILAGANCLEMAFLGMAYATRLVKCTGSSKQMRMMALYGPPVLMFFSAGLGAYLGEISHSVPAVFVAFVAFGVVALLFLVCNELLIEARNAQGEDERWWISIMTFAGIYVVLILEHSLV